MAKKVRVTRDEYKIFYSLATRWIDNDVYGHVNNVTYYSYFDTAANMFLINHCGLDIRHGNVIGFVVSSGCEYLAPVTFPDKIEVGLRVDHLGNSSVQYSIGIFKHAETNACAFGHFVHVFVERSNRRPVTIPDEMRSGLKKILVEDGSADVQTH